MCFGPTLRLRPDTGSSPLAMSMEAAEGYYESVGQNWERAALIKAAPVAGDLLRVRHFWIALRHSFGASTSISPLLRTSIRSRGRFTPIGGTDLSWSLVTISKSGGEAFGRSNSLHKTQQLIAGGRDPSLRVSGTCNALSALVCCGRLDRNVADELERCYEYLRRLEHRLQMIADEQTIPFQKPMTDWPTFPRSWALRAQRHS